MKLFKKLSLLSVLSTAFGSTSEAVTVEFKTCDPRTQFIEQILNYDDDRKNAFLNEYTVQKVSLRFTNQDGKVLEQKLNNIKKENINESAWTEHFTKSLDNYEMMDNGIETEINLPEDWIIKSLEISFNNLPYVHVSNYSSKKIGSTNSIKNLAQQENIELSVFYYTDPFNKIPTGPLINIEFN